MAAETWTSTAARFARKTAAVRLHRLDLTGYSILSVRQWGEEMDWLYRVVATAFLCLVPQLSFSTDSGLITKESKHSVSETAQRFESAVNDKSANGWMVFTEMITRQQQKKTD